MKPLAKHIQESLTEAGAEWMASTMGNGNTLLRTTSDDERLQEKDSNTDKSGDDK